MDFEDKRSFTNYSTIVTDPCLWVTQQIYGPSSIIQRSLGHRDKMKSLSDRSLMAFAVIRLEVNGVVAKTKGVGHGKYR
jgi:hypothetical protein